MADDLLALAYALSQRAEPFVLATVVRCERPTSAKPGAKAIVRGDGSVTGWIGGACAEPTVVREALAALGDGQPRFIGLIGEGGPSPGRTEGVLTFTMTCHSGGTLEIYLEPTVPKPELVLVGGGPVLEALAGLGQAAGFAVVSVGADPRSMAPLTITRRSFVVVATHSPSDEDALARVLAGEAGYVSLVASRKRAAAIVASLRSRGIPADRLGALKAPAGLDIGAVTPEEIAVSILAEIVQIRRSPKTLPVEPESAAAEARDPICGMMVEVTRATYRSDTPAGLVYFCCLHCKERFDRTGV